MKRWILTLPLMRISGAGNVCQRAKQIKDAAQRTMNSSKPVIPKSMWSLHQQNKQLSSNTPGQRAGCRGSSLTLARHIFTVWPQMTQQGPALCVPDRTAVLIYCKSRLFQPANPNTAPVNGTRWTAGVVLHIHGGSFKEPFRACRGLETTFKADAGQEAQQVLRCASACVSEHVNCELRFPRWCSAFR